MKRGQKENIAELEPSRKDYSNFFVKTQKLSRRKNFS